MKEIKEIDANSFTGTNLISAEDWLKHFSKLLFMKNKIGAHNLLKKSMEFCLVMLFLIWTSE